jgi:hypothetical protein
MPHGLLNKKIKDDRQTVKRTYRPREHVKFQGTILNSQYFIDNLRFFGFVEKSKNLGHFPQKTRFWQIRS